ncbi:MAG: hypothetical protein HY976_01605 [Candidatus Kerfeldbacteria bacterium]|nr:hypothetical protein [Candidatus Kerfeldbacteria bacterium]
MEFLAVLGFILPFGGLIVFLLFLVALMNEKGVSRGSAIRMAFSYVVAAVMLSIIVSTGVFLLQRGLKAWVFTKAETSTTRFMSPPPAIFLASEKSLGAQTLYACTDTCQFTQTDKDQLTSWREAYKSWQQNEGRGDSYTSDRTKRDLASAFSFLLVSLPLFIWFFVFMVQREWKKRHAQGERPGPLRTAYYYFIAFAGLIGLVISGALLINVAMKTVFGINDDATSPVPTIAVPAGDKQGVQSIINCSSACNFSAEDKALAESWMIDFDRWQKNQTAQPVNNSQSDLANLIPIVLMTAPLFFYHFLTIRRESKDDDETEAKPA